MIKFLKVISNNFDNKSENTLTYLVFSMIFVPSEIRK